MMDLTPPTPLKPAFSNSSTPVGHTATRKRKHDDSLIVPSSPKFSSTLNESLIIDLKHICSINSLPNTPEKLSLLTAAASSPIQESRKILCNSLKIVKPSRDRKLGLLRSRYTYNCNQTLLNRLLNINVIMDVIFQYMSGGDLYRFSLVSHSFYQALERSATAFHRYKLFKGYFELNKENYVITPPGSPEKCDSPPRTSSENFNKFIRVAKCLNRSQSLTKCWKCNGVSIVDNDISQCQNYSCGLIYCQNCSSSSETGAKDFKDACGHASLRSKLGNMSNQMEDSFFNFSNYSSQDSGFYSENETPPKVKRNLFHTSADSKVLSVSNWNKVALGFKNRDSISYIPVVPNTEQIRKPLDCDSPPRYSNYAVGSKQSKKNLKRLTR